MERFPFSGAPTITTMVNGGFFFFIRRSFSLLCPPAPPLFFSLLLADVEDVFFFYTWHEVLLVFLLYVQSHELLRNTFILTCEVCTIFNHAGVSISCSEINLVLRHGSRLVCCQRRNLSSDGGIETQVLEQEWQRSTWVQNDRILVASTFL